MYVTGFSFIKNAIKMDYPIKEAILSILPLCDEVVVAVGESEDDTRNEVLAISPKITVVDTKWDMSLKTGGVVLAEETNKALKAIGDKADWLIYIQGDEVLHEDSFPALRSAMEKYKDDANVDGLLVKYRHFFGSYEWLGIEGFWYRQEIRVIKNNKDFFSYRDAQGFRKKPNEKLNVKPVEAYVHHYGWVHPPQQLKTRVDSKVKLYNEDAKDTQVKSTMDKYPHQFVRALKRYTGTHPKVMTQRINDSGWTFDYDEANNSYKLKDHFKNLLEKITGRRFFEYKNYTIV